MALPRPVGRLSSGDEPRRLHRSVGHVQRYLDRPQNAMGLARTLMVATMVIAVGTQYAVITAENHDISLTIVNEDDPFA